MGPPELRFVAANKYSSQQQQESDLNITHLKVTHSLNERETRVGIHRRYLTASARPPRLCRIAGRHVTLGLGRESQKSFMLYIPGPGKQSFQL